MATIPTTRPGDLIREIAAELRDEPPIARDRLAAAYRSRQLAKPAERPTPKEPAHSPEPCPFCQIPGRKGCAHFLPYEAQPTPRRGKKDLWTGVLEVAERRNGERHPIYQEIIDFCSATGMTKSGVCREAGFDSSLFTRIQEGAAPAEDTIRILREFMQLAGRAMPGNAKQARIQRQRGGLDLLRKIEAHCEANDVSLWRFGREVLNDPSFCSRLRAGSLPSEKTVGTILRYLDANGAG